MPTRKKQALFETREERICQLVVNIILEEQPDNMIEEQLAKKYFRVIGFMDKLLSISSQTNIFHNMCLSMTNILIVIKINILIMTFIYIQYFGNA